MLTMTHSTSQHRSPQESPTHLPDEGLLGIPNGVDTMSLQDEDDDITEPIAPCTSLTPSLPREQPPLHQNGGGLDSSSMTELSTSEIPEGIACQPLSETAGPAPIEDIHSSIIDQDGYSLEEFILYVRNKTRNGLFDQYQEIKSRPPDGTFDHARMTENLVKNRYTDVLCYDHTRVVLTRDDNDQESDYINANYVDGYKQKNAFISMQGPLPRTFSDTWQMLWELRVVVIVMTTRTIERHRTKCGQYWPELEGESDHNCSFFFNLPCCPSSRHQHRVWAVQHPV